MALKPEIKKDLKKESKSADIQPVMHFAFSKKNYILLISGVVLLFLGYVTLSGGGTTDPNKFSYDLFSARRMVVAPFLLILGYGVVGIGILVKDKTRGTEGN